MPLVRNIILGTYSMGSDNETDWDEDEDEAGDRAEFEFEFEGGIDIVIVISRSFHFGHLEIMRNNTRSRYKLDVLR